jgi:hypothetical protein
VASDNLSVVLQHLRGLVGSHGCDGVPDAELLERFLRLRDEAAFELLVWRHGSMVLGVCRRVLRHVQESEDAFQATWLTLARKAGTSGKRQSVASWLYKRSWNSRHGCGQRVPRSSRPGAKSNLPRRIYDCS